MDDVMQIVKAESRAYLGGGRSALAVDDDWMDALASGRIDESTIVDAHLHVAFGDDVEEAQGRIVRTVPADINRRLDREWERAWEYFGRRQGMPS